MWTPLTVIEPLAALLRNDLFTRIGHADEIIYSQGLMDGMLFGYCVTLVSSGAGKITV